MKCGIRISLMAIVFGLPSTSQAASISGNTSNTNLSDNVFATQIYEQNEGTITVTKNNPITTVDIYDNMICSMNIEINSLHQGSLQSIFQIGNSKKYQNYPSIFIDRNLNNGFKIRMTNTYMSRNTLYTFNHIELNTSYYIKIEYTQNSITVQFNDTTLLFDPHFAEHLLERDKTVYAGNPWHNAADATITDLRIYGWNNHHNNVYNNEIETVALHKMVHHLSAPWIIVSVLGIILLLSVACLGYLNYKKLKLYRATFDGKQKRTLRASTNEVIQYKIKYMQNDGAHYGCNNDNVECIDDDDDDEWHHEFYGVEPMAFPQKGHWDDIVTPI